jgi:hypothetical protein
VEESVLSLGVRLDPPYLLELQPELRCRLRGGGFVDGVSASTPGDQAPADRQQRRRVLEHDR